MTTSFINEQVDQELSLGDMHSINGGFTGLDMFLAAVAGGLAAIIIDQHLEYHTGKGISEHIDDANRAARETLADGVDALVNGTDQTGDTDVVTTGS